MAKKIKIFNTNATKKALEDIREEFGEIAKEDMENLDAIKSSKSDPYFYMEGDGDFEIEWKKKTKKL